MKQSTENKFTPTKGETLMATKKTTNHYYVLVFANDGPAYVTSVDYSDRSARWDKDELPMEFSKSGAEDLVFGLCCNFHQAVLVTSKFEIDYQPYNYKYYTCKFEKKPE
jgi:hypothetical protein